MTIRLSINRFEDDKEQISVLLAKAPDLKGRPGLADAVERPPWPGHPRGG